MASSPPANALLDSLSGLQVGPIAWHIVGPEGDVRRSSSGHKPPRFVVREGNVEAELSSHERCVVGAVDSEGSRTVLVFPAELEAQVAPFVAAIVGTLHELDRLEHDLEGMYPSSLALLEEISMVSEIMPLLATGSSDREVAEMGLRRMLYAASIERGFYLRVEPEGDACEALVQVAMDAHGRNAISLPCPSQPVSVPHDGIVRRAISCNGDAILEAVPEGGSLGCPGSPESLAKRQAIAVPVRFGDSERSETLGVLLLLDKRANNYSSKDKFGSDETKLAVALAAMLGAVLGSRKLAEIGKELEMAKVIQRQILPEEPGKVPGFDLAGLCMTSGAVGGDYFDYLPMADGRQLVVVADVSGHNLASGMLMVSARATLRVLAAMHGGVVDIFDDLGAFLFHDLNKTERFITAIATALKPDSRVVEFVGAGHNAAMVYRARTGAVEVVATEGPILGFFPAPRYAVQRIELAPGDSILLYTDGLTEAIDERDEMFGEERLAAVFAGASSKGAKECLAAVVGAVVGFRDRNAHRDDITAVVIQAQAAEGPQA